MKINPKLFLKALGTILTEDPSEYNRFNPVKCRCPLHPGEESMTVMCSPDGNMSFKCSEQTCSFNGDAIALICARFNIGIKSAIDMLKPGGMLAACLDTPMTVAEAEAYSGKANTQLKIKAYLSRCRSLLAKNPARSKLRAGLDITTLKLIPPEIGLLEIGEDMPEAFSEFKKSKYKKANLLTFPYTYNGDVMHVKVINADNFAEVHDISIIRPDYGVFCEDAVLAKDNRRVLAFTNPVAASIYYGTVQKNTAKRPLVVALSGFPLPHTFSGVADIDLIEFADSKVDLDFLLETMESDDFVEGGESQPQISLYPYTCESLDAKIGVYNQTNLAINSGSYGLPVATVVANRLSDLYEAGKTDLAVEVFQRHNITSNNKESILEVIRDKKLNTELCKIVTCNDILGAHKLVLGNKKVLVAGPKSIECEGKNLEREVLANFGMTVDHKVRGFDEEDYIVCRITPEDKDFAPVTVELPENSWSSTAKMRKIITRSFATAGSTPYIAMYDSRGVSWYDIISKLAEGCKMRKEITKLGVDELRDVYFTNVVVNTRIDTIQDQNEILRVPTCVSERFDKLSNPDYQDYKAPYKYLLERANSLDVAAFLTGLCHIIYRLALAAKTGERPVHGGRHLFYVETEEGCFGKTIEQLNSVFSSAPVYEVSSGAPIRSLEKFKQLGNLPLICKIPRVENVQRLVKALDDAEFPVIASVDSYTASLLTGRVRATFVTPSSESISNHVVDSNLVDSVRRTFAKLLLTLTNRGVQNDEKTRTQNAVMGYRLLCNLLGMPDADSVKNLVSGVFAGAGMSGVDSFFEKLHFGVSGMSSKFRLCVVYGRPQQEHSFTKRGQHIFVLENEVLIGKYVVDLVNKFSYNVFSIDQLDDELNEREFLVSMPEGLDIDKDRCWCIPREVYEDRIVGKPLKIEEIKQPSIQLP